MLYSHKPTLPSSFIPLLLVCFPCNLPQLLLLFLVDLRDHFRQQALGVLEQGVSFIHFLQFAIPKYQDPVRIHYSVQSVCNGQHSTLAEILPEDLLEYGISSAVRHQESNGNCTYLRDESMHASAYVTAYNSHLVPLYC